MGENFAFISFYLSLIFGLIAGMLAFFKVGRIGMFQFLYWLKGVPRSTATDEDNFKLILGSIGIPTSVSDLVASVTNLSVPKGSFDLLGYFVKHLGGTFSYFSSILGKACSKIWLLLGLPSFVLSIILAQQGHEYMPVWLSSFEVEVTGLIPYEIDIKNNLGLVISLTYASMYFLGRLIGSPQRAFNKARLMYETVVLESGYWFDVVGNTLDSELRDRLLKLERIYNNVLRKISDKSYNDPMLWQQLMVSFYQYALLYCTLGQYDKAEHNIDNAEKLLNENMLSSFWEGDERKVIQSQMLFLRGEIMAVKRDKNRARELFIQSLKIDRNLNDKDGIDKINERLEFVENIA